MVADQVTLPKTWQAAADAAAKLEPLVGPLRDAVSAAEKYVKKLKARLLMVTEAHNSLPQSVYLVPNATPSDAQSKSATTVVNAQKALADGEKQVAIMCLGCFLFWFEDCWVP
jgi:Asp/Glu/hydantoin racemase